MADDKSFDSLMAGLRAGDPEAAAALLKQYEPHIRRMARVRLTSPALRRQMDSVDICQSILADFMVRFALGQYEITSPDRLLALLATLARNKVVDQVNRHQAARRDIRRTEPGAIEDVHIAGDDASPSRIASGRELLAKARALLNEDERYLVDQRAFGRGWNELSDELGIAPDALRKRYTRAVSRVAEQMGLSEMAS